LGWGKKFTTPATIAILKRVSEKENYDVALQVLYLLPRNPEFYRDWDEQNSQTQFPRMKTIATTILN
jgi:hypothetical protein